MKSIPILDINVVIVLCYYKQAGRSSSGMKISIWCFANYFKDKFFKNRGLYVQSFHNQHYVSF